MPDRIEDRPRQVHGQPRAGTRPVGRVRRERVLPPLPAETAEGGRVDVPPVLLGHDRAEEGRDACARIPQAHAHVLLPVARMGDGRAQEGVDAGKDRGAAVFCQIFVGRFGVSFSPFERLFLGRFGFGQSCGLSVIA